MVEPREHSIIAGKYRLIRQLGQGGMGSVWLAEHLTLCSHIAIKLIHVDMVSSPEVLGRFLREAQAAASLRSPHVVQILDHGVDNGTPYIAMELLEGESLADRLARVGRLEPTAVARIMTEIGRAVGRAHEAGIVHRDLKPDNVFIVRNDDAELTKVLDFGIAKATLPGRGSLDAAVASGTRTGAVLGTPYYMSPEQAEGARSLDHRADIWALGVIAYESLLGRRPFDAETLGGLLLAICTRPIPIPSQLAAVPPGFDAWFARACNRDLGQRFNSARDATLDLKRICDVSGGAYAGQPAGPASSPDASGPVPALSGPVSGPALVAFNQSVSGLSATQLDTSSPQKRNSKRALFASLGGGVLLLGGALLAWSHFKSETAVTASTIAAAPASISALPRPAQSALSVELSTAASSASAPMPASQSPAPVPEQSARATAVTAAPPAASEHARTTSAVHAPSKRPPPAQPTAATQPTTKAPPRSAVNLGI